MKIVIACEHQMIRESIRMLLNSSGTTNMIIEVSNEQELINVASDKSVDVLICDSELPGLQLATLSFRISNDNSLLKILIFTDSIKVQQIKHQFNSIPVICIDQPDSGDQILRMLNKITGHHLSVMPDKNKTLVESPSGS